MLKDQPIKAKQGAYYMMSKSELLTEKAKARYPQPPFHTRFLSHYNNPFKDREQKQEGMNAEEAMDFFRRTQNDSND